MKTVLILLALSSLAHADLSGERHYANYAMQYAGTIYAGESTYSSGWAKGMTPSQARNYARSAFYRLSPTERARWSTAGRSSTISPRVNTAPRIHAPDPAPGRPSSSRLHLPPKGTKWIGEDLDDE